MMASDLETDPRDVPILIAEAKKLPDAIITASRWRKGGGFEGYSRVKLLANWTFQKSFSALYATRLTDMTYGYRIFPTRLVQAIQWEEVRHPLLFETLIKPMRLGVKVVEIPSVWKVRHEGESQNTFFRNFEYFKTGLRADSANAPPFCGPAKPSESRTHEKSHRHDYDQSPHQSDRTIRRHERLGAGRHR